VALFLAKFTSRDTRARNLFDQARPRRALAVTERRLGEGVRRSWLVPAEHAEGAVLDEWAELHDRVLGYPPSW
jgi:hypothetical protein